MGDLTLRHVGLWKYGEKEYVQLFDFGRMDRMEKGQEKDGTAMDKHIEAAISGLSEELSESNWVEDRA